ncbi:F-box protein CPR1-like [Papaver somniferum]|uniref:F-box protein CPR1-like n=1 Tax=Papaver somniferum TaxID=3469 RepID=UPI000E6F47B7|nr:F-box protein CPR1-like [Papaver somniferum]
MRCHRNLHRLYAPLDTWETNLCLWNPYTKNLKEIIIPSDKSIPANLRDFTRREGGANYGFRYDCSTHDYKIVKVNDCITLDSTNQPICNGSEIQVYSLKSNFWSTLPCIIPYAIDAKHRKAEAYFNEAPHWIALRAPFSSNFDDHNRCIIFFDVGEDCFGEVLISDALFQEFSHQERVKALGVVRDCFSLVIFDPSPATFEILGMVNYGVRDSWTKFFTGFIPVEDMVDFHNHIKLLWEFKSGEVLFAIQTEYFDYTHLVVYNPVQHTSRITKIPDIFGNTGSIETYVESLVSFSNRIYEGEQEDTNVQAVSK